MGQNIKKHKQRVAHGKLLLEIMRTLCRAHLSHGRFGASADEILLGVAVFIGQAEGRPMNASKLADFAGMARPTVIRRLEELRRRGLLVRGDDGFFTMPVSILNGEQSLRAFAAIARSIRSTADAVARLDTTEVAAHEAGKVGNGLDESA